MARTTKKSTRESANRPENSLSPLTWTESTRTASETKWARWRRRPSCSPSKSLSHISKRREQLPVRMLVSIFRENSVGNRKIHRFVPADNAKLEEMVRELSSALMSVKHEQEYMEVRERVHRNSEFVNLSFENNNSLPVNENTNSRVVMWAAFEAFVLVGMTVGQIFYLKRFFEVRTMVWSSIRGSHFFLPSAPPSFIYLSPSLNMSQFLLTAGFWFFHPQNKWFLCSRSYSTNVFN